MHTEGLRGKSTGSQWERARAWHRGAVTPRGCCPGAVPEPPGAAVWLRQRNSRKAKRAYAGRHGHEGTGERGTGAQSRRCCTEITTKPALQPVHSLGMRTVPTASSLPAAPPQPGWGYRAPPARDTVPGALSHTGEAAQGQVVHSVCYSPQKCPVTIRTRLGLEPATPLPRCWPKSEQRGRVLILGKLHPKKRALTAVAWGHQMPSGLKGFNNSKVFVLGIIPLRSAT